MKTPEFKQYKRSQIAELRPYQEGEQLPESVSISQTDRENGSPKVGDMIARNPKNHDDQWLVAKQYFDDNFEAYHSQFEGECEWNFTPLKHKWYAECDDDTPSVSQATMMFYNYCPFCGRKIKKP